MIFLILVFLYKLRQLHDIGDGEDQSIIALINKTTLLAAISIISNILAPISVLIRYKYNLHFIDFISNCLVTTDIYTNFGCIVLSYTLYDPLYQVLCKCSYCCKYLEKLHSKENNDDNAVPGSIKRRNTVQSGTSVNDRKTISSRNHAVLARISSYRGHNKTSTMTMTTPITNLPSPTDPDPDGNYPNLELENHPSPTDTDIDNVSDLNHTSHKHMHTSITVTMTDIFDIKNSDKGTPTTINEEETENVNHHIITPKQSPFFHADDNNKPIPSFDICDISDIELGIEDHNTNHAMKQRFSTFHAANSAKDLHSKIESDNDSNMERLETKENVKHETFNTRELTDILQTIDDDEVIINDQDPSIEMIVDIVDDVM